MGSTRPAGVEAVTALVHAYAELLDAGDLDGVARLFDRAVWRSPQHPGGLRGVEAVRRVYDGRCRRSPMTDLRGRPLTCVPPAE